MASTADEHENENQNDNENEGQKPQKPGKNKRWNESNGNESTGERGEPAKSVKTSGPTFAAAEPQLRDLSSELVQTLPRSEGEIVRCRRIWGNRYRCNWWGPQGTGAYDNPAMGGLIVTTHRVIRSRMIRATPTAEGLVIEHDAQQ